MHICSFIARVWNLVCELKLIPLKVVIIIITIKIENNDDDGDANLLISSRVYSIYIHAVYNIYMLYIIL